MSLPVADLLRVKQTLGVDEVEGAGAQGLFPGTVTDQKDLSPAGHEVLCPLDPGRG